MPRNSAWKRRATGPGPLRTARGAGREAGRFAAPRDREAGARLLVVGFLVLRDRVLEPLLAPEDRADPDEDVDVLLLRDPGGEDVRVAMTPT